METSTRADVVISVILAALFIVLAVEAGQWNYRSALFPQAVGVAGLIGVAVLVFVRVVLKRVPAQPPGQFGWDGPPRQAVSEASADGSENGRALRLLAWIVAVVALSWLLGQMVAMSLFLLAFLRVESGVRWATAAVAGAFTGGFLYVVFDRVLSVTWLDGAVYRWLGTAFG